MPSRSKNKILQDHERPLSLRSEDSNNNTMALNTLTLNALALSREVYSDAVPEENSTRSASAWKNIKFWQKFTKSIFTYEGLHLYLNSVQFGFSLAVLAYIVLDQEILRQIMEKGISESVIFILFELVLYFAVRYTITKHNVPSNYISLLMARAFIVYNLDYNFEIKKRNMKKNDELNNLPEKNPNFEPFIFFTITVLAGAGLALMSTKLFRVFKWEKTALCVTSLVSTFTSILLVTSMGLNNFGLAAHLQMAHIWSIVSFFSMIFIFAFWIQRFCQAYWTGSDEIWTLLESGNDVGEIAEDEFCHFDRVQIETLIFFLTHYLALQYIPIIHQNFNFLWFFQDWVIFKRLIATILPTQILDSI